MLIGVPGRRAATIVAGLYCALSIGCGTTRWTDTSRTATEQLVLSAAIDQAVSTINFSPLSGAKVFFDDQYLSTAVDRGYLVSALRNQLMATGCLLQSSKADAEYVVEARAGAVGTDRHDLLFGVPQLTVPAVFPTTVSLPSSLPEIPFAKKTQQVGVAKLAVYAYEVKSGTAVWQSGVVQKTQSAKDVWVLGVGPFQHGPARKEARFAGGGLFNPLWPKFRRHEEALPHVTLTEGKLFRSPNPPSAPPEVIPAAGTADGPTVELAAPIEAGEGGKTP